MKNYHQFMTGFWVSCALGFSSSPAYCETPGPGDVASLGGTAVTMDEFRQAVERLGDEKTDMVATNPVLRRQYLDHLINSRLLSKEAVAVGIEQSADFKARLEDKRNDLLATMYIDQYFRKEVTPKSLKAYFEKNRERFSPREARASHIITDSEAKAKAIINEARTAGVNFDDLVKKYGTPIDGALSGDLGYFTRGRMMPEFDAVVFGMKKSEVHPSPVKTQFGWHVIKLLDIRGEERADFAKVQAEVERQMKTDLQRSLLAELRNKANVKINEEAVKSAKF